MINESLTPKDLDGPLRVLVIGRSSLREPTALSQLAASWTRLTRYVRARFEWPIEFYPIFEQTCGAAPECSIMRQALMLIETGAWDLVMTEDITRISRHAPDVCEFLGACVKAQTRVIALDSPFDTSG